MAETLVIVESPSKAKTIEKYLGSKYRVIASNGHVRDLPKSQLGVDVEHDFEPKYITLRGRGEVIEKIRKEAKHAKHIVLATDPDREGEAISWHLAKMLKLDENEPCRVVFNEITKTVIQKAVKNPRCIDRNLVDAQQARRVLDRLLGYKISPLLWAKVRRGLSAGRVQSVTTKLICDREREILDFVPKEYWTVTVKLHLAKRTFEARGPAHPLADFVLDADAVEVRPRVAQAAQGLHGGDHQLAVDRVVRVDLLHEAALGRELVEHRVLGAAQHVALLPQRLAQELGLGHDVVAVAVAPLPRKALPVAQRVEVQDVDHVPDLAAAVVDGRSGQADDARGLFRHERGRAVLLRAAVAQFLDLVKDHGGKVELGQRLLPPAQQQVVDDIDLRAGQVVGLQAPEHVHRGLAAVRVAQEGADLPLPVRHKVRRHHQQQRIGLQLRHGGQRLAAVLPKPISSASSARGVLTRYAAPSRWKGMSWPLKKAGEGSSAWGAQRARSRAAA